MTPTPPSNPAITLSNSAKIPQLGFGVYLSPPDKCVQSCLTALQCGYRHIDTAQCYGNETEVGQAIKQSGLARADVFLTTKILEPGGSVEKSYESCLKSIKKLDVDAKEGYVDLMLIHNASCGKEKVGEMWQALERLYDEGRAKSIGVSNAGVMQVEEMREYAKVWPPHVNQIELHPWLQQRTTASYCNTHAITIEAYCPLARNTRAHDPRLLAVANKHNVSTSRVLIRWCLQRGYVPLPKSDDPGRIEENADVFGFELDEGDVRKLDGLDRGREGALVMAVDED